MRRLKRRTFTTTMGKAAAGLVALPTASLLPTPGSGGEGLAGWVPASSRSADDPASPVAQPGAPKHWVWVHGGREQDDAVWRESFARARTAGIRAVLVSGGDSERLATLAAGERLEYHRWIWTLNRNGDSWVRENHPEWFSVSRNGDSSLDRPPYVDYYRWLCPSRPEVVRYLADQVAEIAAQPGLTGVHLDYVRHPDVILPVGLWAKYDLVQDQEYPEFDFCYCEVCRRQFRIMTGVDPLDLPDPTADEAWRRFRWDGVTRLVNALSEVVHAEGRVITAAVFPTPAIARRLVRQAWEQWRVDAVFPMLYHSFYEEELAWIGESVREGRSTLPSSRSLYAGLYLPDLPPAELAEAARIALEAGASGISLFSLNAVTGEHWTALEEVLAGREGIPAGRDDDPVPAKAVLR